jgi:hypothetical protein
VFPEGQAAYTIALPPTGVVLLGRGAEAGANINHDSVSRAHARVHMGNSVTLEDLGSLNGTKVLGHRLEANQPAPLAIGAVVEIGDVVCMLREASTTLPAPLTKRAAPVAHGAVFQDESMRELYGLLELIGPSDINVLILGETGVGKDVFASALHESSPRKKGTFVRINCAALPESTLEAELFGYEKGAFTGAVQSKEGLFEAADGGSVFLDEIGEVPLPVQAKLLRVVENREVTRLGSVRPRKVDCRIISATNRDLEALSATGSFRSDLYFRLAGASVLIPPLRRRGRAAVRGFPPSTRPPRRIWPRARRRAALRPTAHRCSAQSPPPSPWALPRGRTRKAPSSRPPHRSGVPTTTCWRRGPNVPSSRSSAAHTPQPPTSPRPAQRGYPS